MITTIAIWAVWFCSLIDPLSEPDCVKAKNVHTEKWVVIYTEVDTGKEITHLWPYTIEKTLPSIAWTKSTYALYNKLKDIWWSWENASEIINECKNQWAEKKNAWKPVERCIKAAAAIGCNETSCGKTAYKIVYSELQNDILVRVNQ